MNPTIVFSHLKQFLGVLDRWRSYYHNNGEPLLDRQIKGSNYRNIQPVDMIRPYKITGRSMDPDIEMALDGIEIDDE